MKVSHFDLDFPKVKNVLSEKNFMVIGNISVKSSPWALFVAALLYVVLIVPFPKGIPCSLVTISFVLIGAAVFCLDLRHLPEKAMTLTRILKCNFALYVGLIFGAILSHAPESIFWVSDSVITHVPMAEKMVEALHNGNLLSQIRPLVPGTTTHFITAICFIIFGKSTISTLIALMLLKTVAAIGIYFLVREIYKLRAAYYAALLYILSPTVLFYTVAFYKEAAIQAMIAWTLYFFVLFFKNYKIWAVLPFLGLVALISFERIYLPWLILPSLVILSLFGQKKQKLMGVSLAICGMAFIYFYTPVMKRSPLDLWVTIQELRQAQMSYTDYSFSLNYEIPYIFAVLKVLFTPFFTSVKFTIFSDLSYLLIWGTFFNQIIILAFLWQWFQEFKKEKLFHLLLVIPFIAFVMLLAYIAPWAGRIRDSFYPLIVMYAGLFFSEEHWKIAWEKIKSLPHKFKMD